MAYDAFIKFDTIDGESTDTKHPGSSEIYSFSWGGSNPVTIGSHTSGAGASKVSFSSFNIMKRVDKSTPILLEKMATGTHIAKATVTLRKAGGTQLEYMTFTFTEVYIESLQMSGSSGGDDTPTESLSIAFATFVMNYTPQTTDGTLGTAVPAGWDLTKNVTKSS